MQETAGIQHIMSVCDGHSEETVQPRRMETDSGGAGNDSREFSWECREGLSLSNKGKVKQRPELGEEGARLVSQRGVCPVEGPAQLLQRTGVLCAGRGAWC